MYSRTPRPKGWRKPTNSHLYELDTRNPLCRALVFYGTPEANGMHEKVSGVRCRRAGGAAQSYTHPTKYGWCSNNAVHNGNHFDLKTDYYPTWSGARPVKTTTGDGTGAFTLMTIAAPTASATRYLMFGLRYNPYFAMICINSDRAGTPTSGYACMVNTKTTYQGAHAAGAVDGQFHAYVGTRRRNNTTEFWVDGQMTDSQAGTAQDVYVPGGSQGNYIYVGGIETTVSLGVTDPILVSMAWDRDLSESEIISISRDPFQLLTPTTYRAVLGQSVGGGGPSAYYANYVSTLRRRRR